MQVDNELFLILLALFSFAIGYLISFFVNKIKQSKPIAIDYVYVILTLIENFVTANPQIFENSWNKFYSKVKSWIEKNIKIDLSEEQWKLIEEKLLELYNRFKEELKKEEGE